MTKDDAIEIVIQDMGLIHGDALRIELAHTCAEHSYKLFLEHGDHVRLMVDADVMYRVSLFRV